MRQIKKNQGGFTLIELVVVIVILGILAATAIPKFVDLSTEAGKAAASGVAGAIASGSAANYAAKLAGKGGEDVDGINDTECTAANLEKIVSGVKLIEKDVTSIPDGNTYRISGGEGNCSGAGVAITCSVEGMKGGKQNATVICTGGGS